MKHGDDDRYLTLPDLIAYSGLGKTTLRDLIRLGELPAFKPCRRVLVLKSQFDAWMVHYKVKPASDLSRIVDEVMASLKSK